MRIGFLVCFVCLATFCFSQAQSPHFSSLPLTDFQMPDDVRQQFQSGGCMVAQSNLSAKRHNVLHGEFAWPGQEDWIAVCETGDGRVQVRFVWGWHHQCNVPLATDMVLRIEVSGAKFFIVPYFTTGAPRGESHKRLLQRWSPTGVWSYYCNNGQWERSPGDSCNKTSREERVPSASDLKLSAQELSRRRDFKDVAAEELREVYSKAGQKIDLTGVNTKCEPIASLRQICHFQMTGDDSLVAAVVVERIGKQAWFASKIEATSCHVE